MLTLLILVFAICLCVYGSLHIWPNRSVWWLLQWRNRQHYRVHFQGADYNLDTMMVMIARVPNLTMACLLKRLTPLPIYCLNQTRPSSKLLQRFLQHAHIHFMTDAELYKLAKPGLILISADDYAASQKLQLPFSLIYLAGTASPCHTRMRLSPRDLQLSLQRFHEGEITLDIALQRLSVHAWEHYVDKLPSIIDSWLDQAKALGSRLSVADSMGIALSHHRLITSVITLHTKLFTRLSDTHRVGICLPNSVGGTAALLTLFSLGKTVVALNYTSGMMALKTIIEETGLTTIITSKLFVANLRKKGFPIDDMLTLVTPIYLEDLKASMTKHELLKNYLLARFAPTAFLRAILVPPVSSSQVAVILFSSGSEGKPKGVELTHKNIIGNVRQVSEMLEAHANDVVLSVLPTFHAFGLTAATLLPLMEGISIISHPDPTDTATIGTLAQQYKATILFGTSTFLRLYAKAKNITPEMFAHLRVVVAGAERLLPEARSLFEEKFKKVILEGYGATELSPVASVNLPDTPCQIRRKIGSVGRAIHGCMIRIVDPDTGATLPIGDAGLILVGGVNVMKGYLNSDSTQTNILYEHGIRWYKTGDKGRLDADGFLTISDRYSRFAKLAGEAVSLTVVEQQISMLMGMPELELLAVAIPDPKKGEMIVLLHTKAISSDALQQKVDQSHLPNLQKPSKYLQVEMIPKLGVGKTDFAAAKGLALQQ